MKLLNEMEILIKENDDLKNQLVKAMEFKHKQETPKNISGMLKMLPDCAVVNADKQPGGKRYPTVVKELGYLLYSMTTLEGYEFLCSNLPLSSVTNVRSTIYSRPVLTEGVFRINELLEYLKERNLPLAVYLSEDATRVEGRIQYHPASNQAVGFTLPLDDNGVPEAGAFPATSAKTIAAYFENHSTSNYAYCIMAQPLSDNHPSFC